MYISERSMKNIIIEIDGIKHELVNDEECGNPCDICSLADLCDDAHVDVGICVDLFNGTKNSFFRKK